MISTVDYVDAVRVYQLRGIRRSDVFVLADSLAEWKPFDTPYSLGAAVRDVENWGRENAAFAGLPASDFAALTWTLVVDREPVGFCRIVYLGTQAHIHFQVIHPDHRGAGYFTVLNSMLRTLIQPMGVERVTFESIPTAPAVTAHAETRLELTPTETKIGLTGQEVTSYEFTAEQQAERLKDPKHADETIPVAIIEGGEVKVEAVDDRPAKVKP